MAERIVILGAGPTGIGAALRLLENGHDNFLVLEALDRPGGLAASFVDKRGFTWDIGGHVQFSHYAEFDRAMDLALGAEGWHEHERRSFVRIAGRFVPYPLQNNIHRLDPAARDRCLEGLEEAARGAASARPGDFEEWILATFGSGLAELFMFPYNRKVWAYPLKRMDFRWIGDRVSVVDVERVRENIRLNRDDAGWGPNNTFRFPKKGGTGAIWRALAARVPADRLKLSTAAVSVDLERREVITSSGVVERYDRLLSSVPLDRFGKLTGEADLARLGSRMVFSSAHIVGVGLKGRCPESLQGTCWMYFPEENCPFYRVTLFSHYSPENVPDPSKYWSLMTETAASTSKPVDTGRIVEATIRGLKNTRLIPERAEIASTWHFLARHGYPTPFLGRDEILAEIHRRLEGANVLSRGRFGGWKYEVSNQDHSFMQGAEAVDFLLHGKPEVTYHRPDEVNRGKKR